MSQHDTEQDPVIALVGDYRRRDKTDAALFAALDAVRVATHHDGEVIRDSHLAELHRLKAESERATRATLRKLARTPAHTSAGLAAKLSIFIPVFQMGVYGADDEALARSILRDARALAGADHPRRARHAQVALVPAIAAE